MNISKRLHKKLIKKLRSSGKKIEIRNMPTCNEKMSDVILKFAAPLTDDAPNDQAFRLALEFAIIVWNISLSPVKEREQHLNQIASQFYQEGPDEAWSIINLLLDRKEKHLSRYRRIIVDYELSSSSNQHNLSVASIEKE